MTSRLQLHLSARDLKNVSGWRGTSDPFAIVTIRGDNENNKPYVIGQTDVVFNNLNPSWSNVIFLDGYRFGLPLYFEVGVFDFDVSQTNKTQLELSRMDVHEQLSAVQEVMGSDSNNNNTRSKKKFPHRVMGTALFEVGQVLGSRGNVVSKSLQKGAGILTVHVERCKSRDGAGSLSLQLCGNKLAASATNLTAKHFFYELFRRVDRPSGAVWESVYRSNSVTNNNNKSNNKNLKNYGVLWNKVKLNLDATCNADLDRSIKIVLWEHKRSGKHKYLGECETTVHGILAYQQSDNGHDTEGLELMRDGRPVGLLQVVHANLTSPKDRTMTTSTTTAAATRGGGEGPKNNIMNGRPVSLSSTATRPEFVDYLSGGCQISVAVAIDFTSNNGDPREPGTPHYFHPPQSKEWNDYEKALFAVGSILAKYDSDQRMPVWGFGAKYNGVVRHCFQCGQEVEVDGLQGIMDAYRSVFRTPLTMSYPTHLTEVIETAAAYARHKQEQAEEENQLSYTILLILTAGNLEDAKETQECLIDASEDPLSVVIVGIGDGDFSSLEMLGEPKHHPQEEEEDAAEEASLLLRDITKFVKFSDFKSFHALTEAVLDEIPHQLVEYYFSRNMPPGPLERYDEKDVKVAEADDDERTFSFLE